MGGNYVFCCSSRICFNSAGHLNGIIDYEGHKPRMKTEFRVMIAELLLNSSWTKLKTIPRNIFIPSNRGETSLAKEN